MKKQNRIISIFLVLCLLLSMVPVQPAAAASGEYMTEQEPNDEKSQATPILQGCLGMSGELHWPDSDREDWFMFSVPARATVNLTVKALTDELVVVLERYGLGIHEYIGDDWYRYTVQQESQLPIVLDAGTYYFYILSGAQGYTPYIIYLELDVCDHADITAVTVEPTCREDGYIQYTCGECGYLWREKNGDALGHEAGASVVTAPNCTEQGFTTSECSRCGETYDHQFVPPWGHTVVADAGSESSCTEDGLTEGSHCCVCGEILVLQEVIPAPGHREVVVSPAVEATCETAGLTARIDCSLCGAVLSQQKTAPALGHRVVHQPYQAPGCTETGLTAGSCCSDCGKVLKEQEIIPALGHKEVIIPGFAPTCTKNGWSDGKFCSACAMTLEEQKMIPPLSHVEYVDVPAVNPTCTKSGSTAGTRCSVCGEVVQAPTAIASIAHSYVDGVCSSCGRSKVPTMNWELSGTTLTISGSGDMPDYQDGSTPWEAESGNIQRVIIEDGITGIGASAFYGCSSLRSLVLPDSLTGIGEYAFGYCSGLSEVVLPEGLTSIGDAAFNGCSSLTKVVLPDSVTAIGTSAFAGCKKLTGITFSENLTTIGIQAFRECTALGSIVLPDSITYIGKEAFSMCTSLRSAVLPAGCAWTAEDMFAWCTSLESVTLPAQTTSLSPGTFAGCTGLKSITLPEGFHEIANSAFSGCTGLTSLVLPASVDRIADYAFNGCSNLSRITMKGTMPELGASAFYGLAATISYPSNETSWNQAIQKQYGGTITWEARTVNSGVLRLGQSWAYDPYTATLTVSGTGRIPDFGSMEAPWYPRRTKIKTLVLEEGITGIGTYGFQNCTGLTKVVFPDSFGCDGIGQGAFYGCTALGSIDLPDIVRSVDVFAFYGCSGLRSITLPAGLTHIYGGAFEGCTSLTEIRFRGSAPVYIGDGAFENVPAGTVYYPADDPGWTQDAMQGLGLGSEWIPYCPSADSCGEDLTWEYDPDDRVLTVSGTGAMENYAGGGDAPWFGVMDYIEAVVIGEGVTEIGDNAFRDCGSLVSLTLPQSLTRIGSGAFRSCTSLGSVTLQDRVTAIDTAAFAGCEGLSEITFQGDAPDFIGESAFFDVAAIVHYPAAASGWAGTLGSDYGGDITWIPVGLVENRLTLDTAELEGHSVVWVDGKAYEILRDGDVSHVELPDGNAKVMTLHTYSSGTQARYPVGMKVWTLKNENGAYTAVRQEDLDDLLQYSGMSIRVSGQKGIRMITSIDRAKKRELTAGTLAGFTLKEYGTAFAWASQLGDDPLVLGRSCVKHNYAYRKGVADPVFAYEGSLMQYTNVLVGFRNEHCGRDFLLRPYMILEDAEGNERTLYGGTVQRSIGYIALQNRHTFEKGTEASDYIWDIIRSVYGDSYGQA